MTFLQKLDANKLFISIFLVLLFHVSAIIGIAIGQGDYFLPLTPLNLLLCFGLILWNIPQLNLKDLGALAIPFLFGMVAELLGVNFGLIFGTYEYGANLGPKIWGVPWIIGVNWSILVFATASVAQNISQNKIIRSIIGAVLMVLLDVVIEKVAPKFDFWEFENGIVPLQNYMGWLVVSFLAHLTFQLVFSKYRYVLGSALLLVFLLFFGIFAV